MSTPFIILVVVICVLALAIAAFFAMQARRRGLRQRFGPEYDRLAAEHGNRKAEAELTQRQRHVRELDIHPLTPEAQARYVAEWAVVQERFVETPKEALKAATGVVTSAMRDRGYPTENYDQMMADLSVEHAHTLTEFRQAHEVGMRADTASTEDLRQAMIRYRALFQELVGADGDGTRPAPGTEPGDVRVAGDANADARTREDAAAEQPPPVTAAQEPPRTQAVPPQAPRR
jgi:hypothetical protein